MTSPDSPLGPLRILIADRRGWIARALINVLEPAEWRAVHCHDALHLLQSLSREEPHAIILHDDLQDIRLEELLPRLRADPTIGVITPIVVLSTRASRARRLELLRAGATEFLVFPSDPETLLLRLRALAVARREVERLRSSALIEADTGLYNPAGIAWRSREIATDATRRREPLSCVAFAPVPIAASPATDEPRDIEAVREVGGIVRRTARFSDAVGRIDQIVVVLAPATDQRGAQRLAERIQERLASELAHAGEAAAEAELPGHGTATGAEPRGVRAAYCTVSNFARSSAAVPEMIQRAIAALATSNGGSTPAIVGESVPLAPDDGSGSRPANPGNK